MICFLALQRPVWQRVGAMEMSLKPASTQLFSSAWNQMVSTSKERHVGRSSGQWDYLMVIILFGQHSVTPDSGQTVRLLLWVLGSTSEMENQYLPVQHWRHWEPVGDSTYMSSVMGFQVQ